MHFRVFPILLAFFVMGFGDARGGFVGIARETYGISASQGSLIPAAGALAFGLFALPAGILATRFGMKRLIELGLLLTAAGHALPCLLLSAFSHLLLALFVIGAGMTCLLVAGNPLLREVTGPARFARDLTFAQFIKSLGSISGPYLMAAIVALDLLGILGVIIAAPMLATLQLVMRYFGRKLFDLDPWEGLGEAPPQPTIRAQIGAGLGKVQEISASVLNAARLLYGRMRR